MQIALKVAESSAKLRNIERDLRMRIPHRSRWLIASRSTWDLVLAPCSTATK